MKNKPKKKTAPKTKETKPVKPKGKKIPQNIVAEGEATGHAHRAVGASVYADKGQRTVVVEDSATIVHEEHKPVSLSKGRYATGIVREVDPFKQKVRRVTD